MRGRLGTLVVAVAALAIGASGATAASAATGPAGAGEGASSASEAPAAPASGGAQQPGSPAPGTSSSTQLSNEQTLTTWAHPEGEGPIYTRPDPHARRVARVHMFTEDGFPEVYLLLSSFVDAQGREWVRLRIPGRPNGRVGWVLREMLGSFHDTRWRIVVDTQRRRMSVYYSGRPRKVFPVGVGKPRTPTPTGHFWIRERFKVRSPSNPYWPYALGTSDYSTLSEWPGGGVIGIHGAFGEPQKIPGDPSHGCIRMLDPDIAWLAPRITLGTPVDVTR